MGLFKWLNKKADTKVDIELYNAPRLERIKQINKEIVKLYEAGKNHDSGGRSIDLVCLQVERCKLENEMFEYENYRKQIT